MKSRNKKDQIAVFEDPSVGKISLMLFTKIISYYTLEYKKAQIDILLWTVMDKISHV